MVHKTQVSGQTKNHAKAGNHTDNSTNKLLVIMAIYYKKAPVGIFRTFIRKGGLEYLVITGKIEGKRVREKNKIYREPKRSNKT